MATAPWRGRGPILREGDDAVEGDGATLEIWGTLCLEPNCADGWGAWRERAVILDLGSMDNHRL